MREGGRPDRTVFLSPPFPGSEKGSRTWRALCTWPTRQTEFQLRAGAARVTAASEPGAERSGGSARKVPPAAAVWFCWVPRTGPYAYGCQSAWMPWLC